MRKAGNALGAGPQAGAVTMVSSLSPCLLQEGAEHGTRFSLHIVISSFSSSLDPFMARVQAGRRPGEEAVSKPLLPTSAEDFHYLYMPEPGLAAPRTEGDRMLQVREDEHG